MRPSLPRSPGGGADPAVQLPGFRGNIASVRTAKGTAPGGANGSAAHTRNARYGRAGVTNRGKLEMYPRLVTVLRTRRPGLRGPRRARPDRPGRSRIPAGSARGDDAC